MSTLSTTPKPPAQPALNYAAMTLFESMVHENEEVSSETSLDNIELRIQWLEVASQAMHRELRRRAADLKFCLNTNALIHQLPVELLSTILLETAILHSFKSVDILRLSAVCRHWHGVINFSCHLWSTVRRSETPGIVAEKIARSKAAPLTIECSASHAIGISASKESLLGTTEFLDIVRPEVHRWRSFYLKTDHDETLMGHLDLSTATMLQDLSLGVSPGGSYRVVLPEAGHLSRVHLQGAQISWESTRLTRLQCLQLHDIEGAPPTVRQLASILRLSPQLERLVLDGLSQTEPYPETDQAEMEIGDINMPSLSTLILRNIPKTMSSYLLASIHPSARCALSVHHLQSHQLQDPRIHRSLLAIMTPWLCSTSQIHISCSVPSRAISICTSSCPLINTWSDGWWQSNNGEGVFLSIRSGAMASTMLEVASLVKQSATEMPISFIWETELVGSSGPFGTIHSFPLSVLDDLRSLRSISLRGRPGTEVILRYMSEWRMDESGRSLWPCPLLTSLDLRFARDIGPRDVHLFKAGRWGSALEQADPSDDPFAIRRPVKLKELRI